MLFNALFRSHLEYGIQVWGTSKNINKIEKIQKKMIRALFTNNGFGHTEPIMANFGILKVPDLFKLRQLCSIAKINEGLAPPSMDEMCQLESEDSRRAGFIKIPARHSKLSDKLPKYYMAKTWNHTMSIVSSNREKYGIPKYTPTAFRNSMTKLLSENYATSCDIKDCYTCNQSVKSKSELNKDSEPITTSLSLSLSPSL
jgi:hypothetical protein